MKCKKCKAGVLRLAEPEDISCYFPEVPEYLIRKKK